MKITIREYLTPSGRNPFRDWLDKLDVTVRARIQARMLRFDLGNLGDHKMVGRGVWEARLAFGPGYRIISVSMAPRSFCFFSGATRRRSPGTFAELSSSGPSIGRQRNMARRSRDWNVGLAQDLRDQDFAREFLLAAIEEGISIQHALGKAIRAIGVKEFAAKVGMASPNLLRAINPRHNPTQQTLNRLLKPFRLRLSLAVIEKPKGRHAA